MGPFRIRFVWAGIGLPQQGAAVGRRAAFHWARTSGLPQPIAKISRIVGNGVMLCRVMMPGVDQGLFDSPGSDPFDEQIGGHVVAGNHLAGRLTHRDAGARRQCVEAGGPQFLGLAGDGHRVVPANAARQHGLFDGKQHVGFENRSEREGFRPYWYPRLSRSRRHRPLETCHE